jgi:hypothetical protein
MRKRKPSAGHAVPAKRRASVVVESDSDEPVLSSNDDDAVDKIDAGDALDDLRRDAASIRPRNRDFNDAAAAAAANPNAPRSARSKVQPKWSKYL